MEIGTKLICIKKYNNFFEIGEIFTISKIYSNKKIIDITSSRNYCISVVILDYLFMELSKYREKLIKEILN